jgi:hypothetical protein
VFRAVFNRRKKEFSTLPTLKNLELTYHDGADAITEHIKGDPKVALMLLEATWKGTLYVEGSVQKTWFFMEHLRHRLGAQDYDTLLLFLHTIYGHVVLEISWAA